MRRTEWLQEIRRMSFEEAYAGWQERKLAQEEAGRLLGVSQRTFRRYVERYEDSGMEGLRDKRPGNGGRGAPGRGCWCIRTARRMSGWRASAGI
jgi:transposase